MTGRVVTIGPCSLIHGDALDILPDLREHYDRMDGLPWHGQLLRWDPRKAEFRAQWPLIARVAADDREGSV